jgi:hypothetical protein
MDHFRREVESIAFQDARRRYCLPVLAPDIIKCTEVPINPDTCASEDPDRFVKFKSLNVTEYMKESGKNVEVGTGLYKIASPYPNDLDNYGTTQLRIDTQGRGVMVVQAFSEDIFTSLIGGANAYGEHGYASKLHRLMYDGKNPDTSNVPDGATYDFAARCKITQIMDQDNLASSWRQVDFTLHNGVLRANVTDERCPNARAINGTAYSGFMDLYMALQGAADIISSTDGYSKFFNEHPPTGAGTNVFAGMNRLETIVNQIYHIVQTAFSQSSHKYAMQVSTLKEQPIMMTSYPHLYIIRMSWTPTTYIGLILALLITLNAWVLAARWARATYRFGLDSETLNLLRPIDLMAYTLAGSRDLIHCLDTTVHRKMEMDGKSRTVLQEYPVDLISVMSGRIAEKAVSDYGSDSSPITPAHEYPKTSTDVRRPAEPVHELEPDLERGEQGRADAPPQEGEGHERRS